MEEIYAACIAYEPCLMDYIDFKKITEPVWLLGRQYNVQDADELEKLNEDMKSCLWFTYRKQFAPIGDTTLTSDAGWGCMHRCGQMLLAQALIYHHLGRDWRWRCEDSEAIYHHIRNKFNDNVESQYSIHRIACMSTIFEKQIGQWLGPNAVAQVLKKLVEEDPERSLSIHVAMDNMVIKKELRNVFRKDVSSPQPKQQNQSSEEQNQSSEEQNQSSEEQPPLSSSSSGGASACAGVPGQHPVLLCVPLRLGLSEITPVYFDKLKSVFTLKQTLGIIGGRTNHASYFIGYVGNELIYLDPHTTQPYAGADSPMDDNSYHCSYTSRMSFSQLNPSIALCFYLKNEEDFESWCKDAQKALLEPEKDAVFEILEEKPPMLPYLDLDEDDELQFQSDADRLYTSDEEFELLM